MSRRPPAPRSAARPGARRPAPAGRRGRRVLGGLLASAVLSGFLLVGVFPTRDWLDQRAERAERRAELAALDEEQRALRELIAKADDPAEIEARAREEHGMVRPGEAAYRILPQPVPPVDLPDAWPFTGAEDWLNR